MFKYVASRNIEEDDFFFYFISHNNDIQYHIIIVNTLKVVIEVYRLTFFTK